MTGRDRQDSSSPLSPSVPDLINEYRAQQDAWRAWESQLERLHDEILATAERHAATIVATARADIRRILVEARRDLLVLSSQVGAATEGLNQRVARGEAVASRESEASQWESGVRGATPGTAASETQERLLAARHDVRRVLDDARPDIERLSQEAQAVRQRLQPHVNEPRAPLPAVVHSFPAETPRGEEIQSPRSDPSPALLSASHRFGEEGSGRRSRMGFAAFFTLAAAAILLGLMWWSRPGPASVERGAPQAGGAPAPAVLASGPSPAVEEPLPPSVEEPSPPAAAAAPQSLSLVIEASREAWIQSTIDGKTDAGRLYHAGDTRKIEGAQSVLLRVGDAGAVHVSVNGREPEILGQDKRIVTRRYTADAAPAPSASIDQPSPSAEPPLTPVTRGTR